MDRVIYGDGKNEATVTEDEILITDGAESVVLSRAAFREVVIGWERLLDEEAAG